MKNSNHFSAITEKLKAAARKEFSAGRIENALQATATCATMLYNANPVYADDQLEAVLTDISQTLSVPDPHSDGRSCILFYDGFGVNSRGLIQIYLNALCALGQVVYVAHEDCAQQIPDVLQILQANNCRVHWLTGSSRHSLMQQLHSAFESYRPAHAFLYTYPDDVSALAAFERQAGSTLRYQINLTDHAFWLGRNAFDYCIEFRDYGACISRDYRQIPEKKLVKLPFYPSIDHNRAFDGIPFSCQPDTKIIFSGGALYKTLGGENRFYKIVRHILDTYPQAVFWYAGTGDRTQMDLLIADYPGRAFLTPERADLFQVLQHCFFYLSTYPLCGGLMFQYAASAGKLPITLKYDDVSDDFLLNQSTLGIEFSTQEEVEAEIHHLFTDPAYMRDKERQIRQSVADKASFDRQLENLLRTGHTDYPIHFKVLDTARFRQEYLDKLKDEDVLQVLGKKRNLFLLPYMPISYLRGLIINLLMKLRC